VATIPPVGAILREVVGARAQVSVLLPAGASPHTYEPRPSDATAAAAATALFYVSPQLDEWGARLTTPRSIQLLQLLPASRRLGWDSTMSSPVSTAGLPLEDIDPHFWTDPTAVRALLPALADTLASLDPDGAAVYRAAALRFGRQLDSLDSEIAGMLAPVAGHGVVLLHPSFRYLLRRYRIPILAIIEPAPGKEPTARYIAAVADIARRSGASAVFTEPQLPTSVARLVAETAGLPVDELDPLGGVAGRRTYAELLRYNARVLRSALK
jgi:zinc transport system substrate-binding protein